MVRSLTLLGAFAAAAGCGGGPRAPARTSADSHPVAAATHGEPTPSWLAAAALDGPYRDVAAFCAAKAKDASDGGEDADAATDACAAQGTAVAVGRATVQVVRQPGDATSPDCALALHTAGGWFVTPALGSCGGGAKYGGSLEIEHAEPLAITAGRPPAIGVALHGQERAYNETDDGKAFELETETRGTLACSISGKVPVCTPLVVSRQTASGFDRDDDAEAFPAVTWSFRLRWPGDGTLVVAAEQPPAEDASGSPPGGGLAEAPPTQVGTFRIELP